MWRILFCLLLFTTPPPSPLLPVSFVSAASTQQKTVSFMTLNLWNNMFNWDVRKHHIAETISSLQPDLVALQEVLDFGFEAGTQLNDLQKLLPHYQHGLFVPSSPRQEVPEGLAILSRHPLTITSRVRLTVKPDSPDRNQRILVSPPHTPPPHLWDAPRPPSSFHFVISFFLCRSRLGSSLARFRWTFMSHTCPTTAMSSASTRMRSSESLPLTAETLPTGSWQEISTFTETTRGRWTSLRERKCPETFRPTFLTASRCKPTQATSPTCGRRCIHQRLASPFPTW